MSLLNVSLRESMVFAPEEDPAEERVRTAPCSSMLARSWDCVDDDHGRLMEFLTECSAGDHYIMLALSWPANLRLLLVVHHREYPHLTQTSTLCSGLCCLSGAFVRWWSRISATAVLWRLIQERRVSPTQPILPIS